MVSTVSGARLPVATGVVRAALKTGALVRLSQVTKQFGDEVVLRGAGFRVRPGELVGVVGARGAGKTVLASVAAALLPPDEGQVRLFGRDPWEDCGFARSGVGLVPDRVPVADRLSCFDVLVCCALRSGAARGEAEREAGVLLAACELGDVAHVQAAECTTGQQVLLRLAAALLGGRALLVLDDPFAGVDGWESEVVRAVLREFAAAGGGVLCTARDRAALEDWCDTHLALRSGSLSAAPRAFR
ncbi:ATP-binding cassette domain-containing protein [Actinosynnema pretiosum subsp. pretiosum]|uniref:ABC transporter related n=2 Tax=Actinosynnema TaxID=40566 RepID=C6WMT2_ACTMD|nr:ATP-binding cassette domain-containing protein [Actinosynnema mirum]ACU36611.1 ABC transporter related [Actinosynnema mirum DSM 43827]AXX30065.1 ABC transporter, ATP-binding protein [Actinosynnema pretiosum subsp. pretiosum]QUF05761.1 ATP-binding cassette domain-containing protein [Actinosynnema pretiosum subsp. pretiosum]